ncbi:hypothetical protein CDCA_CDCA06G2006 [Cyanidium caldarium]|uniref:Not1-domain-containing protein n=1 Tax=Cyanidium caldarium TaxID=2771 RepID=A0AAV9IV65_CYACA|nr:hypothetical protein CDCA_CDCA06G2006 [Cyanidium caldarium]
MRKANRAGSGVATFGEVLNRLPPLDVPSAAAALRAVLQLQSSDGVEAPAAAGLEGAAVVDAPLRMPARVLVTAVLEAHATGGAGGDSLDSDASAVADDEVIGFTLRDVVAAVPETVRRQLDAVLRQLLEDEDESVFLVDAVQIECLCFIYQQIIQGDGLPVHVLTEKLYANAEAQISMLSWGLRTRRLAFATSAADEALQPITPIEGLHQSTAKMITELDAYQRWGTVRLLESVLAFGDTPYRPIAYATLEQGIREAPEVLAAALAEVPKPASMGSATLREQALDTLLPTFLVGTSNPNSAVVIRRVWQSDRASVIRASMQCWQREKSAAARLLDVAQDLKAVPETLAVVRPYEFAIDLALLASRREYINLRKWLKDRLQEHGTEFLAACLNYLSERTSHGDATALVSLEATVTMLKVLTENVNLMNDSMREELEQLCRSSAKEGDAQEVFPADIEEEANSLFQRVFSGSLSYEDAIEALKKLQYSGAERDEVLLRCVIHNLLDEYRFLPKYPDRELRITAELFGGLIQHELVAPQSIMFTLLMRYILEALRKTPPNKMLKFGLIAVNVFKERLLEWPQYTAYLLQMTHLRQAAPEMIAFLGGASGLTAPSDKMPAEVAPHLDLSAPAPEPEPLLPPPAPAAVTSPPLDAASSSAPPPPPPTTPFGISSAHTLDTLLSASREQHRKMAVPDASTQDKIHFIFNNLSTDIMASKVQECFSFVRERHWEYLAHYIVVKRASIEPNFHATYLAFLEHAPRLQPLVLTKSYENVRVLLESDKIRVSTSERSLLKNLGMWIGALTLGKNRPILQRDLDLKALILRAYESALLIAVIPFVCKILDACRSSRVFRLPNPWLQAVFGLLKEVYEQPELKLNLKFEIEVLCKNVGFDLSSIHATQLLGARVRPYGRENPDFTHKEGATRALAPPPSSSSSASASGDTALETAEATPFRATAAAAKGAATAFDLNSLGVSLQIAASAPPHSAAQAAQAAAQSAAMAEGVTVIPNLAQQIVINASLGIFHSVPSLKRAVPVAIDRAIREIIQPVVERSASVASITTRELVRKDFHGEPDAERVRYAMHQMARLLAGSLALVTCKEPLRASMLSLVRTLLSGAGAEPAAVEQAAQVIVAENLDTACSIIERGAVDKAQRDVEDALAMPLPYTPPPFQQTLPPQLLLSPPFALYEQFGARTAMATTNVAGGGEAAAAMEAPVAAGSGSGVLSDPTGVSQAAEQRFAQAYLLLLSAVQAEVADDANAAVTTSVQAKRSLQQCAAIIRRLQGMDELCASIAAKVFQRLLECRLRLYVEVHVVLLQLLAESSPPVKSEVARWCHSSSAVVKDAPPELWATLQHAGFEVAPGTSPSLLPMAPPSATPSAPLPRSSADVAPALNREQLSALLEEWIRLLSARLPATGFLQQLNVVPLESWLPAATAVALETTQPPAYHVVDAFARLVIVLLRYRPGLDAAARVTRLHWALTAAAQHLLSGSVADPRPHARYLHNLLVELSSPDSSSDIDFGGAPLPPSELTTTHPQVLAALAAAVHSVRPTAAPLFAFSWLELVCSRHYLPRMLLSKQRAGWPAFQRSLLDALEFLQPFLVASGRGQPLSPSVRLFYYGVLRLLLVVLHDFPEVLVEAAYPLCDCIPTHCVQLRNLVLSAFPSKLRLPDPFSPDLNVSALSKATTLPRMNVNVQAALAHHDLRPVLDEYLKLGAPDAFELNLRHRLQRADGSGAYAVPVVNALVLYVGQLAVQARPEVPHLNVFMRLLHELDEEGGYLLLSAVANHVRYPNAYTAYFSTVLLYLFKHGNAVVREQVARVLIERLFAARPHPWGLLVVFLEIIRNREYGFWQSEFVHAAPEIERLMDNVAKTCLGAADSRAAALHTVGAAGVAELPLPGGGSHLGPALS